ncbi:MAG TPA: MFS transporter [Gemmatimonadaceae bacterium]|nr:MFS transporter [Gemmatimonadaceae bacterium]
MATRVESELPLSDGEAPARGAVAILAVVTLSHFVNDGFTAMLTPLLPDIQRAYAISIAETAVLVAILAFVGSMIQPIVGMIGDHFDRRLLAAGGPVLCAVGMTMMGYAPSFAALGALITLAGLGSAIFHPAGVAYAATASHARRRGLFAALFSAGGTAGLAVGPLAATALDLRALPTLLPIGLAVGAASYAVTPSASAPAGARRTFGQYARLWRGPMRLLWATGVLRSLSTVSYQGLIGFVLTARGHASHIGPSLAVFSLAAALGGIAGGRISDRVGRTAVLRSSILATIPLFIGLVYSTPGQWWYYPLTALVGALVNANLPVMVVTAQEYAPDHVATASALMMGFTWGTAGVLFLAVGKLADLTSPVTALVASILVLLPAFWMTVRLPEPEGAHRAASGA